MFVPPNYISDTIHIVGSMYKLSIKAQRAQRSCNRVDISGCVMLLSNENGISRH